MAGADPGIGLYPRHLRCNMLRMATKHQCIGGCGLDCPNRPVRTVPTTVETYKVAGVPGMGRWLTVQVLAPTRRGARARGTSASLRGWGGSQPKGAKRAKRQGAERMGNQPRIAATNWRNV